MKNFSFEKKENQKILQYIFQFKKLTKTDCKLYLILEEYFLRYISPVYGDQKKFLEKIKIGLDRTCEFLIYQKKITGVIIYKNELSDEFKNYGIRKGIELKTLLLFEKTAKNSGVYLIALLGRVAEVVIKKKGKCIFGTVSSQKPEVLHIMRKLGFVIMSTFKNLYCENVDEYLLCHKIPTNLIG